MITINGKEYNVRYTLRALFIFEQITNKPFKIETLLDNYIFFYSIILASNKDKVLDWDEFIDELDKNPKLYTEITNVINEQQKKDDIFINEDSSEEKKS